MCSRPFPQEFSTSNFFAVTHDNRFVTPDSPAVLPSITNKSLMELAKDAGMVVECRPIPFSEVASFKEVAACGTAVVMTSIKEIVKGEEVSQTCGGWSESSSSTNDTSSADDAWGIWTISLQLSSRSRSRAFWTATTLALGRRLFFQHVECTVHGTKQCETNDVCP